MSEREKIKFSEIMKMLAEAINCMDDEELIEFLDSTLGLRLEPGDIIYDKVPA